MRRSEHWDFVRGLSMLLMFILNASAVSQWSPYGLNFAAKSLALVEPIIFLSGFLICLRTIPQITGGEFKKSEVMFKFALRRMVRTWPLFYLLVAVCFIWPAFADRPLGKPLWAFLTFTMNINLDPAEGLVSMWTLCVEEWCYLIFMLAIPFLVTRGRTVIFLALACASVLVRIWIIHDQGTFFNPTPYMTNLKFPTWSHCDSFFFGCAFAELFHSRGEVSRFESNVSLGLAGATLLLYYLTIDVWTSYFQITIPMWGALASAFLIWGLPSVDGKWLRRTGLVHLGYISYTVYLIHKIVIEHFVNWNRSVDFLAAKSFLELAFSFALTCLVSVILYFLLEKQILTFLRRPFFRPTPVRPA